MACAVGQFVVCGYAQLPRRIPHHISRESCNRIGVGLPDQRLSSKMQHYLWTRATERLGHRLEVSEIADRVGHSLRDAGEVEQAW